MWVVIDLALTPRLEWDNRCRDQESQARVDFKDFTFNSHKAKEDCQKEQAGSVETKYLYSRKQQVLGHGPVHKGTSQD